MKNTKNTKRFPKSGSAQMSEMVSINPNGFWSLGELSCDNASKNYKF